MKKTHLYLCTIFLFPLAKALPQEVNNQSFLKNQIGIQFNPVINDRFTNISGTGFFDVVSSARYGYRITKNVTAGAEFSCGFPIDIKSRPTFHYYNYFTFNTGLFARYSFLPEKRIQVFAEASPFYSHYWREQTSSTDLTSFTTNKIRFYVAPGVSLFSKSRRISLDLYYKLSTQIFTTGIEGEFTYKVCYNF